MFDNEASATEAIDETNGFPLFDKPMRVSKAKTRSDKTIEMNGSTEDLENHKKTRQAEKGSFTTHKIGILNSITDLTPDLEKKKAAEAAEIQRQGKRGAGAGPDGRPAKIAKSSGLKSTSVATSAVVPDEYLPPNKILFLQNVPEEYDVEALSGIFGRFDGFREVRLVPGRRGIAFVEYDAEQGAITAKENTAGMTLGDKKLKVTYQRQ